MKPFLESATSLRQNLSADPQRPKYHFLPPNNWMNDPNGLIYWQGKYHMFYQHNPNNPFWGDIHWGHAVSADLVHWQDLPLALTPEMPPSDDGGCWSGCAVDNHGVPTLLYTGIKHREQTTCMATSDDELIVWQKAKDNPILKAPKLPGFRHQDYRDPYVWREADVWYQVISMTIDNQGQVLLYRSSNLHNWEYLHPLIPAEVRKSINDVAEIWECPNFFPLGDKWVLLVSIWKDHHLLYPAAYIGAFRNLQFYPETFQRLDWGEQCLYAPLSFEANGRRLMFGWLQEQRSRDEQIAAGWSGVMSLPRVLGLEGSTLTSSFASELQNLRQKPIHLENLSLDKELRLESLGNTFELKLDIARAQSEKTSLCLRHSADEVTRLELDWPNNQLVLKTPDKRLYTGSFTDLGDSANIHLYVDHSVIEVIANRQLGLCARVYPQQSKDPELSLSTSGKGQLLRLDAWSLAAIW